MSLRTSVKQSSARSAKTKYWIAASLALLAMTQAHAQIGGGGKAPVEVVSDALEVLQAENKAIFTGNVIATQGNTTIKSSQMTVYYHGGGSDAASQGAIGKGIYRIDATGNVLFTTPNETAQGDSAVYMVEGETLDIVGNVLLTQDKNVLKGTKLNYNMATGRSVLSGGAAVSQGGTGRVRGLFVPK